MRKKGSFINVFWWSSSTHMQKPRSSPGTLLRLQWKLDTDRKRRGKGVVEQGLPGFKSETKGLLSDTICLP